MRPPRRTEDPLDQRKRTFIHSNSNRHRTESKWRGLFPDDAGHSVLKQTANVARTLSWTRPFQIGFDHGAVSEKSSARFSGSDGSADPRVIASDDGPVLSDRKRRYRRAIRRTPPRRDPAIF